MYAKSQNTAHYPAVGRAGLWPEYWFQTVATRRIASVLVCLRIISLSRRRCHLVFIEFIFEAIYECLTTCRDDVL